MTVVVVIIVVNYKTAVLVAVTSTCVESAALAVS